MFFIVSKLLWAFVEPFNFLLLVGLLGVGFMFTRWASLGRGLCVASLTLLSLITFSPLGAAMLRPIEDRFPLPPANMPPPDGIIVLGGALDEDITAARHEPRELGGRITMGAVLARRFSKARLIFTGGSSNLRPSGADEATGVRELWTALGIDLTRVTFETKSRDTWENAILTRALIHPKPDERFLLVTAAWHVPRAMGVFRKVGYNLTAYPTDYLTLGDNRDYSWLNFGRQISFFTVALHEWIGLTAYHLAGKTSTWFPAP